LNIFLRSQALCGDILAPCPVQDLDPLPPPGFIIAIRNQIGKPDIPVRGVSSKRKTRGPDSHAIFPDYFSS
jgi:hypothetical protein